VRGVAVGLVVAALLASAAAAANRVGTARSDVLRGTASSDFIDPRDGRDRVIAGSGADRIKAFDRYVDNIRCGPGGDIVAADLRDRVARDCETVSRRLAVDPLRNAPFTHATHVEPDSFSFGNTIVAVYQVGRAPGSAGGAAAVNGWSRSRDGGRTWRSGLLPSLTRSSRPAGRWERASDPVIGYSARHGVWLASSLVVSAEVESGLTVSRSPDGVSWSAPIVTTEARGDLAVDKQWLVCDNWPQSPHYGNCYHAYTDVARRNRISVQTSRDGGLTWSAPIGSPDSAGGENRRQSPGVQPVVRPDGTLHVIYLSDTRISQIVSTDGGGTLTTRQLVAPAMPVTTPRFRAFSLPVADVGPQGTIYVAWMDCTFRANCSQDGADLALVTGDGTSWGEPARIPAGAPTPGTYYALPGLAADTSEPGRLAVAYYRLRGAAIDAFFVSSATNGARWTSPRRLSPQSLAREWMPNTQYGPMVADYISTSYVNGRPIPILILAGQPRGRLLDQSVFAALVR
jgi:hypothetical protein